MEAPSEAATQKKDPLDALSKDELIKKYKQLLVVAQKAKQTKDAIVEENKQILLNNEELKLVSDNDSRKLGELVSVNSKLQSEYDLLKSQKLQTDNDLRECKQELSSVKIIVQHIDTENQSSKRQLKRLTEENDQLINHLDVLTKQVHDLNHTNKQQQERIQQLEESSAKTVKENTNELWPNNLMSKVYEKISQIKDVTNTINSEITTKDDTIETLQNDVKVANTLAEDSNNKLTSAQQELDTTKEANIKLQQELNNFRVKLKKVYGEIKELKNNKVELLNIIKEYSGYINDWQINIAETFQRFYDENAALRSMCDDIDKKKGDVVMDDMIMELRTKVEEHVKSDELAQKNLEDCQKDNEELKKQLLISKREHMELLKEMNDMNQALKERGETISKQQEYTQELLRQLQNSEQEAMLSRQQREKLEEQLVQVKHESEESTSGVSTDHVQYCDVETASTSTVSRLDEVSRMRDLEGSWEERYTKLRSLALKLKAKVKEMTELLTQERTEKSELQNKLSVAVRNHQIVQTEHDILQEKFDALNKSNTKIETLLNGNDNMKNDMEKLLSELVTCKRDKDSLWTDVQNLKKDIELEVEKHRHCESKIAKLEDDLDVIDKQFALEIKKHKETRDKLEVTNKECKKKSVLSLEMEDYERTLKETVQKLEKRNELITELETKVSTREKSLKSVEEQLRIVERDLSEKETDIRKLETDNHEIQRKLSEVEALISQKDNRIHEVIRSLEESRIANEDINSQLALTISQNHKNVEQLRTEKERLRSQVIVLEDKVRELNEELHDRKQELVHVNNEFTNYKVRAQSVLRQNQTRDIGLEEKLNEEINALQSQVSMMVLEVENVSAKLVESTSRVAVLEKEKTQFVEQLQDLERSLKKERDDNKRLLEGQQQMIGEHRDALRAHKLHSDTLAQCYKQQLAEQEERHIREISEIRAQNLMNISGRGDDILDVSSLPREEGEGSESIESTNNRNVPLPLDKLLDMDIDGHSNADYESHRKQISDYEAKVTHLTELLAETEQDLAKHAQLNQLLKEEIRRHQRSVEREQHAENLEYLKNVILKFLTLNNGDERTHLVPVLNTILKLSPEEVKKLNAIAKGGDPSARSWGSYLPMWNGNQQ